MGEAPLDPKGAAAARRGLYAVTTGFLFTFAGYGAIENLLSTFHSSYGPPPSSQSIPPHCRFVVCQLSWHRIDAINPIVTTKTDCVRENAG